MEGRRWRAPLLVTGASVVGASVVGLGAFVGLRSDPPVYEPRSAVVASTTTTSTTTTIAPEPGPEPVALVADAVGSAVDLYAEPGVVFEARPTMDNPTAEGLPVVFLVLEERGDWLRVQASMRPNGQDVWVPRSQVRTRTVPNRIEVQLAERRLVVLDGDDRVLFEEPVAIGSARTPTPVGRFFVDGWVPLDGTGPYGAGQLSVAGFSDVLRTFGTGIGQIAVHGTNRPALIGQAISNGCVRMENSAVLELVRLAPLGTPVDVVA